MLIRVHGPVLLGEAHHVCCDGGLEKSGSGWSGSWVHGNELMGRVVWTEGAGEELCGLHAEVVPDRQHLALRVQVLDIRLQDTTGGDSQGLVLDGLEFGHV